MNQLINLVIYTKKIEALADFYCTHFGYQAVRIEGDRIVELVPKSAGSRIMLHPLGKGRKEGQTLVKLVFDVEDLAHFKLNSLKNGLKFGSTHQADGYQFANAKDPSGNSIQISSRVFSRTAK